MKKIITLALAALMLLGLMAGCAAEIDPAELAVIDEYEARLDAIEAAFAAAETVEETTEEAPAAEPVNVHVTIADAGELVVSDEEVEVTDVDADGAVTIGDALSCAHEHFYAGGAAEGYAAEETEYGLSLTKLWGVENGGSYGYYINNASAMSLLDAVAEGDHVYAFGYADLETWSDVYAYFDVTDAEGETELTLSYTAFDENWNPVETPLANAVISIDGEETYSATDENGKVTVSVSEAGRHIVSATVVDMTITPPICILTVE